MLMAVECEMCDFIQMKRRNCPKDKVPRRWETELEP